MKLQHKTFLQAIFVLSLLGTLMSLYYGYFGDPVSNLTMGEFFNTAYALQPCTLCWYARILLYPMVVISGIGLLKKDVQSVDYILPLSVAGIALETYHYSIQKIVTGISVTCGGPIDCAEVQVEYLGFVTIPLLGLIAFVSISALCIMVREQMKKTHI